MVEAGAELLGALFGDGFADEDDGLLGELGPPDLSGDGGQGAAQDYFIPPGDLLADYTGGVRGPANGQQLLDHPADDRGAEKERQRARLSGQRA